MQQAYVIREFFMKMNLFQELFWRRIFFFKEENVYFIRDELNIQSSGAISTNPKLDPLYNLRNCKEIFVQKS